MSTQNEKDTPQAFDPLANMTIDEAYLIMQKVAVVTKRRFFDPKKIRIRVTYANNDKNPED